MQEDFSIVFRYLTSPYTTISLPSLQLLPLSSRSVSLSFCLDFNGLTGELPSEISQLWSLEVIDLEFNLMTGQIPNEFGDATKMP